MLHSVSFVAFSVSPAFFVSSCCTGCPSSLPRPHVPTVNPRRQDTEENKGPRRSHPLPICLARPEHSHSSTPLPYDPRTAMMIVSQHFCNLTGLSCPICTPYLPAASLHCESAFFSRLTLPLWASIKQAVKLATNQLVPEPRYRQNSLTSLQVSFLINPCEPFCGIRTIISRSLIYYWVTLAGVPPLGHQRRGCSSHHHLKWPEMYLDFGQEVQNADSIANDTSRYQILHKR